MSGRMADEPRKGSLLVIFLTVFIDLLGFGIVLPLLPLYSKQFAAQHGFSQGQTGLVTGLLMGSFSAMQFLFLPVWGRLSDRFGRRPIILVGLAASTFFYAMFGVAAAWRSLAGLFVARIGAGIAGATISTAQAYIADTTSKEKRAKGMALVGAAFALGFTLGPLICAGSLLLGSSVAESPWPGYVAAALSGAALLLAIFQLPESLHPGSQTAGRSLLDLAALRQAVRIPSIRWLLLTSFIAVFSFAIFESTLSWQVDHLVSEADAASATTSAATSPVRIVEWVRERGYERTEDVAQIVVLFAFVYLGIILTLAQGFLVRRLADRMSEARMAVMGVLLATVGFLWLAWATWQGSLGQLLLAMAAEVVGFAFVNPSLQSLISRRSDPRQQGGILGLGQSATSLARIFGPVCGLSIFPRNAAYPYLVAAGLMVAALALVIIAVRRGGDFASAGAE
jgi:MFS transporter, DHA1 family, tetracycline resistance protein